MFDISNYLETLDCPNCQEKKHKIIIKSNYLRINKLEDLISIYKSSGDEMLMDQLVECIKCNFQYLNPRIKSEIIFNSYIENEDETHTLQDKQRYKTFRRSIKKIINLLNIKETNNKTFLDIGSASGVCLKAIKDLGFKEEGYEPSKWMVEYGRNKYQVNLKPGSINDVNINNKYDLISLWDVLEHVTDLNKTLKRIKAFSKNQTILIINVPDINSLACKIMKKKWPFYLNVHLYYFNQNTIESILNKYGYSLIKHFSHWQFLELGYLIKRAKKYFRIFFVIEKIVNFLKLSSIPIPYNLGQTTFIFKKNNE
tara:strand:- start:363 stop:1298 length:936 start_codon:yes stop_codon:yes gene_type:complete